MSITPAKVTLTNVRLSYPNLFVAKANQDGGKPKFSARILIPKSDVAQVQKVYQAIEAAKQDAIQRYGAGFPQQPSTTLYDGDGVSKQGNPFGEECKGHWVLNTSSTIKPGVVDRDRQAVLDPDMIYSGCYIAVSVNFYGYQQPNSKGIACGLNNVMFWADGEKLTSRTSAEEDFADLTAPQQNFNAQPPAFNQAPPVQQGYPQQNFNAQPPAFNQAPPVQQGYPQQNFNAQPPAFNQAPPVAPPPVQPPAFNQAPPVAPPPVQQQGVTPANYQPQYDAYGNPIY